MMSTRYGQWLFLALFPSLALADVREEELLSMPLEELGKLEVNIATGTPHTLSEAPAVATVITAQDIEAMGAQTMDESLAAVPGLHISPGSLEYTSHYFIRGIYSRFNPETLVLVNGVPQTSLWLGDRGEQWPGVPVNNIARIEVIRGPGSAVYGADAFAGVINVITKSPDEITSNNASVARGSADTWRAGLVQKALFGAVHAAVFVNAHSTAGDRGIIRADAQSAIDAFHLTPPVSLAPGPVNRGGNDADARLELDWGRWRLRGNWQQLWHLETGQGIADTLDPVGRSNINYGDVDLTWHDPAWSNDWDLAAQLSYSVKSFQITTPFQLFPPGAFFGSFPQGVLERAKLREEAGGSELTAIYKGWPDHRLRLGVGFFVGDLYKTRDIKNYNAANPPIITPLPGGMTDVSGTPTQFQPENHRSDSYALVQDEWTLAPHWQLTAGVRNDHYSDFGSTTNPRAALVWQTTPTFTSKLLYGQAFRAPSFSELYITNNPVGLGNPHLHPEQIHSDELAFSWRPQAPWSLDFNLYQFHINDLIEYERSPVTMEVMAENIGNFIGEGMETEWRYQPARNLQLLVNYSHQHTYAEQTGAPMGPVPRDQAYLRVVREFGAGWQLTPQLTWVGSRPREASDPRGALHGYVTLDLTLRRQLPHGISLALIGRNLGNADLREPSSAPGSGQMLPAIPYDLPQPGRTLLVEAEASW